MKKSKVVFLVLAALFLLIMIYMGYDISSKTTRPGSKPQLKERLFSNDEEEVDTSKMVVDTTKVETK
jgi:hypothetical protein